MSPILAPAGPILFPMKRVRLVDVAREAGVHPATASRALSPVARSEVSRRTVRRVEQAAERLGYIPNTLARGLRTSRSYVAALVIPDITNPLFPPIIRGAEKVLSQAGFTLVLTDTNNDATVERTQVASMRAHGVDGFIVATARWHDPVLDELAASDIPTVLVNRQTAAAILPYVGTDDRRGVELCVQHLAQLGHRAIIHLAGPPDTSTGLERASAFRQAMRNAKLPTASALMACSAYTEEAGAAAADKLLASRRPFTAIVAANDLLAIGALDRLAQAGVHCPRDVSITGFNDLPFMMKLTPPLTTVRVPLMTMGEHAARTLLDWIERAGAQQITQTLLPVELIVRGTTAIAPTARALPA
jgi:LacI family transcriptional regulator